MVVGAMYKMTEKQDLYICGNIHHFNYKDINTAMIILV